MAAPPSHNELRPNELRHEELRQDELERLLALSRYGILDTLPEQAFDRVARLAAHALGVGIALVNFVAEDRLWSKACFGAAGVDAPRDGSFCAAAIVSDEVLAVPDARLDSRFDRHPMVVGEPRVRFYAGAPLLTPDGFALGTLCVLDDVPREFGETEASVLREFAALVMDELELRLREQELKREMAANAQMLRDLRRETAHAETLLAVSALTELDLEPAEMTRRVAELLGRVVDADLGCLVTLSERSASAATAWLPLSAAGAGVAPSLPTQVPRGASRVWEVAARGEALFVDDYLASPAPNAEFASAGLRAVAYLPLGARHVFIGARLGEPRSWHARERALFGAAARSVGVALERREHLEALSSAALSDGLTGLGNRRAFDLALEEALCGQEPFGLAVIDLDGMKAVNDEGGHARGDALLRVFSSVLCTTLEARDRLFRLGGDEFALLSRPPAAASTVRARLANVLEVVRARGFAEVGASVGAALYPRDAIGGPDLARLADERMYQEKRERKNLSSAAD